MADVYDELVFHCTNDHFYFEDTATKRLLVIDRITSNISIQTNHGQIPTTASKKIVYGIAGIINLIAGPYMILITQRSQAGIINKKIIWRLEDVELVSFSRSLFSLTREQNLFNEKYISLVNQAFSTPYFYFSYSYDITHSLQRLYFTTEEFIQMPLHERADSRFVWNDSILKDLKYNTEASRFCLPLMHGFFLSKTCTINGEWFTWALISRRAVSRAGTRMWVRGIDSDGSVANYVETEQIIEYANFRSGFVQTRGSIPLYWSQDPNLKYKPKLKIAKCNHEDAFAKHCESQVLTYGKQVFINLIDQKGVEGHLQEAFKDLVNTTTREIIKDNIRYEYFDYHHECRNMRWDRLSILINRIEMEQEEMGYFLFKDDVMILDQYGTFRTNCIDCLDRTNVVQSLLAKRHLQDCFLRMAILQPGQKLGDQFSFEIMFRNAWADHADIISTQYAGTGALKTDFTRTGKRTKQGLIMDGFNSGIRYFKNNFFDGNRQDSIDLLLGKYEVGPLEGSLKSCPLRESRNPMLLLLPLSIFFSLLMVFASLLLISEFNLFTLLSFLFWICMTIAGVIATFSQGRHLVNAPKLCRSPLESINKNPWFE